MIYWILGLFVSANLLWWMPGYGMKVWKQNIIFLGSVLLWPLFILILFFGWISEGFGK